MTFIVADDRSWSINALGGVMSELASTTGEAMRALIDRWRDVALTSAGHQDYTLGDHPVVWWFNLQNASTDQFMAALAAEPRFIVPGRPDESPLVTRFLRPGRPMGARLAADRQVIEAWIAAGAPLPRAEAAPVAQDVSNFRWRKTNAPVASSRTDDIWFLDSQRGWAVNSNGQILFTADGGDSWNQQARFEGVYLRCVGFANERVGWVGSVAREGPEDRLYHTADGGQTWTPATGLPDTPARICGLHVVDELTVLAAGTNYPQEHAAVMKTVDGGATWTAIDLGTQAALLVDIYFRNDMEGWVVGGEDVVRHPGRETERGDVIPVVLYTSDGGATWINQVAKIRSQFPRGEWGWKIQEVDANTMFVSLENFHDGAVLRSDDGGKTWVRVRINDRQRNSNLEGVGFLTPDQGWVGGWGDYTMGGGYSSATSDGGQSWNNANEVGFRLNRFRFVGAPLEVGYASGDTVYKFSDQPQHLNFLKISTEATPARVLEGRDSVALQIAVEPGADRLRVEIWERFGRRVAFLANEENPEPGDRELMWDFTDVSGDPVPPGGYILRVTVGSAVSSHLIQRLAA